MGGASERSFSISEQKKKAAIFCSHGWTLHGEEKTLKC